MTESTRRSVLRSAIAASVVLISLCASSQGEASSSGSSGDASARPPSAEGQRPTDRSGRPGGAPARTGERDLLFGGGVLVASQPYPGADAQVIPVPLFEWRRGRFFVEGIRAGARFTFGGEHRLQVFTGPRFDSLDPDDSPALSGMEARGKSLDLGVSWSYGTRRQAVTVTAITDALSKSDGQSVSVSYDLPRSAGKWRLIPAVEVSWTDEDFVDYYYGVRPEEARPGRPAYVGEATFEPSARLIAIRPLSGRWSLWGFARVAWLGDAVTDSPIVDDTLAGTVLFGALRSF